MNLIEAFKALDALNEDTFSVSDDGIEKLAKFRDDDDYKDEIKIIDTHAETEDDLEDSYVGKVILDCCVCHSKLYKDKEEIEIDEEENLVNVGEECPFCYTSDGFKVVGEVAEFKSSDDEEETEVSEETADEDEIDEGLFSKKKKQKATGTFKVVDGKHRFTVQGGFKSKDEAHDWIRDNKEPQEYSLYSVVEESLKESVNNVNVETDDSVVNVSTEDNGKVTVTTEPKDETASEAGDEVIVPVTDETESEIMNNEPEVEDENSIDVEMDEFDEESFDELGESYLKETYDNVVSYKTRNVSSNGDSVIIEGIVEFESGVKKSTNFIFEAKDCTKSGTYRLVGCNKNLTESAKPFTISGKMDSGKFITESFSYNYKVTGDNGETSRVYGIKRR